MACGECDSGLFGCGCCCASVTGLRGGLPPDVIQTESNDLFLDTQVSQDRNHRTQIILDKPVHIVNIEIALVATTRDLTEGNEAKQVIQPPDSAAYADHAMRSLIPISVSLFNMPNYENLSSLDGGGWAPPPTDEQSRQYFCTGTVNAYNTNWQSHPELFGYFADGGVFAEINVPSTSYGVRVVVNYVDRVQFPPAYHDPVDVMQHYWKCSHGETEFLHGFYAGTTLNIPSSDSVASSGDTTHSDDSNDNSIITIKQSDPFAITPRSTWGTDIWY